MARNGRFCVMQRMKEEKTFDQYWIQFFFQHLQTGQKVAEIGKEYSITSKSWQRHRSIEKDG